MGNKVDISDRFPDKKEVSTEEAVKFAKENNLLFIETSALSNLGVNEAFENLLKGIQNN